MRHFPVATFCALTLPATVEGAILAAWNFDDDATGLESASPDAVFATTTVSNWTPSIRDGVANETGGLSTGGDNYFVRTNDGTVNTTDPTISTTYTYFTIIVGGLGVDEVVNITSVSWDHYATGNSGTTLFSRLFTDLTGLTGIGDGIANQPGFTDDLGGSPNQDLTGIFALQGLGNGATVEFRLYYGDDDDLNGVIHRIDNFVVEGTVTTVPEPAIALLGGLGLLGLLRRRR